MYFEDRHDAGRQLAALLSSYACNPKTIVVGVARGGIPVAAEVATRLDLPLEILIVKKMGAPEQPEFAIGAVTENNLVFVNSMIINTLELDPAYVETERTKQAGAAKVQSSNYRTVFPSLPLKGMTVLLVDDGIATGATTKAGITTLTHQKVKRIIVASPVISADTYQELLRMTDDCVAVHIPLRFEAVGQFYHQFPQLSDDEITQYLKDWITKNKKKKK